MTQAILTPTLDKLVAFGDLKVWSILVTIFGDLVPEPEAAISGPALTALTAKMGIRPEALRVALHRLRKDGWITSHKSGRISHYSLSDHGREESQAVRDQIYAPQLATATSCYLVMIPGDDAGAESLGLQIGPETWLVENPPTTRPDALIAKLPIADIPVWVADRIIAEELSQSYAKWHKVLAALPIQTTPDDPIDRLAARVLILHHWRRIVLRHSILAASFMNEDWVGADCRELVMRWLARLPRTDFATLEV